MVPPAERIREWRQNPDEIHKRPPYAAHSFDGDGRYWVVGTTRVSVLGGWHGAQGIAQAIADAMNQIASPEGM